ncbi:nucleoside diphosphate kinase-like [Corticium candelabrum]|uniref:nucleoside diphosphate kinase-like n=1 Tax=Corticium candelabrum TaxID=121492 RepID=UPI002E2669A0|nr:nucleoside diphosphate kinase-like [Corticium candelabrum]
MAAHLDERGERSFVMLKPEAVQRGLVADLIQRFEKKGFKLIGMKMQVPSVGHVEAHYDEHRGKKFFEGLVKYMSSGPVIPMVWQGKGVVATVRRMLGETDPANSSPGTIRGDFAIDLGRNMVHASDSVETAKREIKLWFKDEELFDWERAVESSVYE